MKTAPARRARAGLLLLLAAALVGGSACYTMSAEDRAFHKAQRIEREALRQRRVAELSAQAAAGDPAAMTALAFALIARFEDDQPELPRVLSLLERAAAAGNVQAQALLGDMLVTGHVFLTSYHRLPPGIADRPRGMAMLKQAASQRCSIRMLGDPQGRSYTYYDGRDRNLADTVARHLDQDGRHDEALIWQARGVLHCGHGVWLPSRAMLLSLPARERREVAAMQILGGGLKSTGLAPDDLRAAQQLAATLRRGVAASEREFAIPTAKESP